MWEFLKRRDLARLIKHVILTGLWMCLVLVTTMVGNNGLEPEISNFFIYFFVKVSTLQPESDSMTSFTQQA